ncbi:hypothetical protein V7128_07445 [Neobacillus vireti]|uniref:hypothetical protein n=1 Tax=Neobacillus vireti TaxID=220686 RepID=UPI0030005810
MLRALYSFDGKAETFELWQIMKDGKDGEVYEVVDSKIFGFLGQQLKVQEKDGFKCLVKADTSDEDMDASNLVPLYGALGTAKYKKVELYTYKEISIHHAIRLMSEYRTVYIKRAGKFKELGRYTDFEDLGIADMSDLMATTFYVKEAK